MSKLQLKPLKHGRDDEISVEFKSKAANVIQLADLNARVIAATESAKVAESTKQTVLAQLHEAEAVVAVKENTIQMLIDSRIREDGIRAKYEASEKAQRVESMQSVDKNADRQLQMLKMAFETVGKFAPK